VTTTLTVGTAEPITLNVQDVPVGVLAAFAPNPVPAGSSSTLTLTGSNNTPLTGVPVKFLVIGTAASAVHAASSTVRVTVPPSAPIDVVATAATPTQINVIWTAVGNADGYDVYRQAPGGSFVDVYSTPPWVIPPRHLSYIDTAVTANTSYLYKVRAINTAGASGDSNLDVATTTIFTDDPLTPASTPIKAVHVNELRTAANALRALANLTAASFTNPIGPGVVVHAIDIQELRSAVDPARSALGLPATTYTFGAAAGAVIHAADLTELRNGVR
jgi:hypothetical protein